MDNLFMVASVSSTLSFIVHLALAWLTGAIVTLFFCVLIMEEGTWFYELTVLGVAMFWPIAVPAYLVILFSLHLSSRLMAPIRARRIRKARKVVEDHSGEVPVVDISRGKLRKTGWGFLP